MADDNTAAKLLPKLVLLPKPTSILIQLNFRVESL